MIFSYNNPTCNDNYVYLNKIFFNESENASPIMTALNTTEAEFTQQLNIGSNICRSATVSNNGGRGNTRASNDCGCGCNNTRASNDCGCGCNNARASNGYGCGCDCCCDFTIGPETTFNITNAYVIVHSFRLSDPASITAEDVTVEGLPITDLTVNGNQFVGDISGIISQITKCACQPACANICPGNFVMITAEGPWELIATIVVEGNVFGNGPTCQFKICFNNAEGTPFVVTGPASFAFCSVDIPCQISGISPSLVFDFDACAKILNPVITLTCTDGVCTPVLTGSLVVTPQADLQTIRPSLFNLGDCEVQMPCDDLGQCNPCDAIEAECIEPTDNCCCGEDDNQARGRNNSRGIACQCCDTNGYGF